MGDLGALASRFAEGAAFQQMTGGNFAMLALAAALVWLAARKGFSPALLIPLGFGIVLANTPVSGGEGLVTAAFAAGKAGPSTAMDYLYLGLSKGFYPALILFGLGALADFGPVLSNPRLFLLGLAAPAGLFATLVLALGFGLPPKIAAAMAPVGGADGAATLFLSAKLAPKALAPLAFAAFVSIALLPFAASKIMTALTTREERLLRMGSPKKAGQVELVAFPIAAFLVSALLAPGTALLTGFFFLGNLLKESGVTDRVSTSVRSVVLDTVTALTGISVGAALSAEVFFTQETFAALVFGVVGIAAAVALGILLAKALNASSTEKVNPIVGGAAVGAAPEAARVAQLVGSKEDPTNYLLAHASGANALAMVGTLVAAGFVWSLF